MEGGKEEEGEEIGEGVKGRKEGLEEGERENRGFRRLRIDTPQSHVIPTN